jgi:hypothetical protein
VQFASGAFSSSSWRNEIMWKPISIVMTVLALGSPAMAAATADGESERSEIKRVAEIRFCAIPDLNNPGSAFVVETHGSPTDFQNYWAKYTCVQPCANWQNCAVAVTDQSGAPVSTSRGTPRKLLAFIVDGMGGFLKYSSDGNRTLAFQGGAGGTSYNYDAVVDALERQTHARTVQIEWAPGFVWGWFTRTSPEPRTVVDQVARPAAVLKWIHDELAAGNTFGTVANSMGTVATLGPVLWYGMDRLIDYQALIGGPAMWDVNASCAGSEHASGLSPYVTGYCDGDATAQCQTSSQCSSSGPSACQTPAPLPTTAVGVNARALWESLFNHLSSSNGCSVSETQLPDPRFDLSAMRFTVRDWTVHHPIDFLVNLNGAETAGGDESWGLGHFAFVYNALRPRSSVSWMTEPGVHSAWAQDVDRLVPLLITRMKLN